MNLMLVTDYPSLVAAIRARRIELGMSQAELDERAGVSAGYTGKVECDPTARNWRALGRESLPLLLGALGLALVPVRAAAAHGAQGQGPQGIAALAMIEKRMSEIGRRGAWKTNARLDARERHKNASKAARIRWRMWRELRAAKQERERRARRRG